jgi:hypothetical protein
MITTLICCFCIVCTAVISTYGTAARASCVEFSLAFSSGSLLISAIYYATIKMTLLAMGTVLELKRGRISIHANRQRFERVSGTQLEESAADSFSSWSFSDDDNDLDLDIEIHADKQEKVEEVAPAVSSVKASPPAEKFSTLKVWTNVYGLAVGTFCMVHSLTLPNEISNTIFCLCLWAEGSLECFRDRSRRRLCSWIRSSTTCLSALLVAALCMKSGGSFISGRLNLPATAWDYSSIIIPVVGVAAIRNMRETNNIQATLELSAPVCLLGSLLCFLVCIFVSFSQPYDSCMVDHLWDMDPVLYDNYLHNLNGTAKQNARPNSSWVFLRHEPIVSMMAIPFPLMCSVVAVVTCSQTSHVLVSSLPLHAMCLNLYASKR